MPLLNYTTRIAASKTIGEMQSALAKAGASHVAATYEGGTPTGLAFTINTAHGARSFALPVDVLAVDHVLKTDRQVSAQYKNIAQAERVAWRILKDWLEAQLAIIATQMVTLDQVMLPYMTDNSGRTVYDLYASQSLALAPGS